MSVERLPDEMSEAGRIIRIPNEIRDHMGVSNSDKLLWYKEDDDSVTLKSMPTDE